MLCSSLSLNLCQRKVCYNIVIEFTGRRGILLILSSLYFAFAACVWAETTIYWPSPDKLSFKCESWKLSAIWSTWKFDISHRLVFSKTQERLPMNVCLFVESGESETVVVHGELLERSNQSREPVPHRCSVLSPCSYACFKISCFEPEVKLWVRI